MSTINNIRQLLKKELQTKTSGSDADQVGAVQMAIPEVPKIIEKRGQDYVSYGEDNLYPLKISDLKYGSAIHNAIVSTAADMIAGNGLLLNNAKNAEESQAIYNGLAPEAKKSYDFFIANENNPLSLNEIRQKLAFDFKEQGACSFEIIFSSDFKKINTIKYVDVKNVRAGKMENDIVTTYWYSRDWKNTRQHKPKEIPAANLKAAKDPLAKNKSLNQLFYLKRGSLEYYGEPDYAGALTWIQTDFQMGIFHLANIENGMNPSMALKFYKVPATENDKQAILDEIQKRFVGPKRTGKHMVLFSEGKELAPDIAPIQTSNLDKQLLLLAELCDRKILTGHKLTTPLLAGISVSGQIGGNVELGTGFKIYDGTRIAPYRNTLDETWNKILNYNNAGFTVHTNVYNPLA
jgi:hypothetical protein